MEEILNGRCFPLTLSLFNVAPVLIAAICFLLLIHHWMRVRVPYMCAAPLAAARTPIKPPQLVLTPRRREAASSTSSSSRLPPLTDSNNLIRRAFESLHSRHDARTQMGHRHHISIRRPVSIRSMRQLSQTVWRLLIDIQLCSTANVLAELFSYSAPNCWFILWSLTRWQPHRRTQPYSIS